MTGKNPPPPIAFVRSPALAAAGAVRHGFFTRIGGVSRGLYAALNCGYGSGDDRDAVTENRTRCMRTLGAESLVTAYQVHGITVAEVDRPWTPETAPRADAMVTSSPGVALGILTADCAPVLMADAQARVIGAAHAGWKGAKAGVVEALVAAMVARGASPARIRASIGPTIGQASYEVGAEFRDGFLADDPTAETFFADGPRGRPHFDLPGFVARRIRAAGVADVDRIAADTCAEAERFFSYRRSCLLSEPDYGRQVSVIALG